MAESDRSFVRPHPGNHYTPPWMITFSPNRPKGEIMAGAGFRPGRLMGDTHFTKLSFLFSTASPADS